MTISAEIGGQHVPLADCGWVHWARCGCPVGVTLAETQNPRQPVVTEAMAWRAFYSRARDVERAKRRGERMGLMASGRIKAEVLPAWGRPCPHSDDKGGNL